MCTSLLMSVCREVKKVCNSGEVYSLRPTYRIERRGRLEPEPVLVLSI